MKFNETLKDITLYEAGKPIELVVREFGIDPKDVVKLASNENPLGTSPAVANVISEHASKAHLYPDDSMYALKDGLAKKFGISDSEVIIGAGSDQILEFIARSLLSPQDSVLMTKITFAMYEIYAKQMGAKIIRTPSYVHKADEFIEAYNKYKPKIIYLCIPNNPIGDCMTKAEALKVIDAVERDTLVVVDGAYMEYASFKDKACEITPQEILKYPNVIYLGTFSKAYGLGGMRVGYGIANEALIRQISKMRPPFNITSLSLAAAIAALREDEFIARSLALHAEQLIRYEEFAIKNSISFIPSYTNFITYLFDEPLNSTEITDALLKQGVIIRNLASYGLNAIRITIGTAKQNDRFFDSFLPLLKRL
ncbi:MAG: histidinol-phosphate aminotransferase [Sulfurovum sp. AS07-7]|nr:MAG: histidinol-phosphate aminotransferase [Sulfurovum sp. AS07-7]